jgi:hypothetical protein
MKKEQLSVIIEFLIIMAFVAIALKVWLKIDYISSQEIDYGLIVLENLRSNLSPEPFERIFYLSFLIMLLIYFGVSNALIKGVEYSENYYLWIILAAVIYMLFDVGFLKVVLGYVDFYTYFSPKIEFLIPVIYLLTIIFYLRYDVEYNKRWIVTLLNLAMLFPILYLWRVIHGDQVLSTGPIWGHLDLILYSISESVNGKSPLYELESQYGFYVELFSVLSTVIDINLSVVTFVFLAIQFAGMASVLFVVQKIILNKYIFIVGQLGVIGISSTFHVLFSGGDDMYLQYYPIRFIFPSIFLLLFINYMRGQNIGNLIILSVVGSLSLFWNLDSGMAIVYAWCSYNFIMFFASNKK